MTDRALSPSLIRLDTIPSTNTYLAQHPSRPTLPHGTVVTARSQSAGRGQRGNSWEAEPGMNITMSMLLRPRFIRPREQFYVSEIVSVAIVRLLQEMLGDNHRVTVKWPNDIYVGDKKICGILIEHTLSGNSIDSTVAGIGLNVNQREFLSDAPNPVSIFQLTGKPNDVDALTIDLAGRVLALMAEFDAESADFGRLHKEYLDNLWRKDKPSEYRDSATGDVFTATIKDVEPTGLLHLVDTHGRERVYAFKEVSFLL